MIRELLFWLIVAAMVVLVVTHPKSFSAVGSTVGTQGNNILQTLTGASSANKPGA